MRTNFNLMAKPNFTPSPIAIFAYKRTDLLQSAVKALQKCDLAQESEVFVFCDGVKKEEDREAIQSVRDYVISIKGFKKVSPFFSDTNKGLASSIINGVSEVLRTYETVIVLEDDLVASANFLSFMNEALETYRPDSRVFSVSGYTVPMETPKGYPYDSYFTKRASSWGWATWKDRWEKVDWSVSDYDSFSIDNVAKRKFNEMGSDMVKMLSKQMKGEISSWAIRWCYHQFKYDIYTVFPTISKISNIGFGEEATHTKGSDNRFATPLDRSDKKQFNFDKEPSLDPFFVRQFVAKYSLRSRAYHKIRHLLGI